MKSITTTLIVALTFVFCATTFAKNPREAKARSLYQQGMIAMKEGNYELAKMSFKEVLRIYPSHPQARGKLIYLTNNQKSLAVKNRKDALRKIIIPAINLDKATVQEAIAILSVQVRRADTKKKITSNFIVQDPTGGFEGKTITLQLKNVPADTVLTYIMDQSNGISRFDKHATVIFPRKTGKPKPKAAGEPKEENGDDPF